MTEPGEPMLVPVADLPVPAVLVDPGGVILDASSAFADLVGRGREALIGQALLDLVAPDDRGRLAAAWTASGAADVDVAGRRSDGLPFVATFSVPPDDQAAARLLVATRRGGPIRPLSAAAEGDSDGRDVIDSALSHDVRGALRGVGGFLTVLDREEGSLSDESRGFLDTARRSAAAADAMAERLVEYARLGQRPLLVDRVDLDDVVRSVLDDRETAGDPPLDIEVDELGSVVGNRSLVQSAVRELLANASKFGATRVVVSARVDGPWRYLRIDDDGPGIDEELRSRAFDLFRMLQPKGRYPGVGAGLALVRRIAEVHGGGAWIEPGDGGGTAVVTRWLAP